MFSVILCISCFVHSLSLGLLKTTNEHTLYMSTTKKYS